MKINLFMRNLIYFFPLVIIFHCYSQVPSKTSYDFAYQKGMDICVLKFDSTKNLIIKEGFAPSISPDGMKLAYTKMKDSNNVLLRYIYIYDLETNIDSKLKIQNESFDGKWSPDNKYITFITNFNNQPQVGLMKLDNSEFKIITSSNIGALSHSWSSDSKYIYITHHFSIHKFDVNGNFIDSIDVKKTFGEGYFVSNTTQYLFSSDNKYIYFVCKINESMKGFDGPVDALFAFDILSKKMIRLSPKGLEVFKGICDNGDYVFFAGMKENEKTRNIFRVSINDPNLKLIIKNGWLPSIRK